MQFSQAHRNRSSTLLKMNSLVTFLGFIAAILAIGEAASISSSIFIENDLRRLALQNPDLYDGDMAGIDGPFDPERNAISGEFYRWGNAKVPYFIDSDLRGQTKMLEAAFENYHKHTCVRFVPRTNERDYIHIFPGKGCYSHVGHTGGQQPLSLGKGCLFVGTVIHELGHVLGLYHEHNRSDRDDYLTIYLENVIPGMEYNFAKLADHHNIIYTTFDYGSIMIYGNTAFSRNGQSTMVAKNGQKLQDPYDKNSMTKTDIERINKMYGC